MKKRKNRDYWRRRTKRMEDAIKDRGYDYAQNLEKQYTRAIREIESKIRAWYQRFATNNGISYAEAQKWLNAAELKELHWTVQEYIERCKEYGLTGAWAKELENASARVHISRLESLKLELRQHIEELTGARITATTEAAGLAYSESYFHTAFEFQKAIGVGWTMHGVDKLKLEKLLSRPWTADNMTFTARCWTDKAKLVDAVNRELTRMAATGAAPDKAIENIAKQFNTSKSNAGRVVMTESAYFASEAQKDCYDELDVDEYEIIGTFDGLMCDRCGDMDRKVFPMSAFEAGVTAPPFHPWCRCTTAPYFEDMAGIGERFARDPVTGRTYTVPKDMTYEDWKKAQEEKYGEGIIEKTRKMRYNEKADREQHARYRERLGDDAPKSFEDFRKLKYDEPDKYDDLKGYYRYRGSNPGSGKAYYEADKAKESLVANGTIRAKGVVVSAPKGARIISANEHAVQQMKKRNISQAFAQNIVDSAEFALKQRNGTRFAYYTEKGFAALDLDGTLCTAGELDFGGMTLYKEVMRFVKRSK